MTRLTPNQQRNQHILNLITDGEWHQDWRQYTTSAGARNRANRINRGASAYGPGVEARTIRGVVHIRQQPDHEYGVKNVLKTSTKN